MSARIARRAGAPQAKPVIVGKFQAKPANLPMVKLRAAPRPRPAVRRWLKTFLLDSVF